MSPIALILNLLLGGLLLAALALGLRLDRRLRALRDSQAGFIKAVADLDKAALRTQAGLQQWREAADEARELLHDRIEKAKVQIAKLDKSLLDAARTPERETPREVTAREPVLDLTRRDAVRPGRGEAPQPAPARAEQLTREILARQPARAERGEAPRVERPRPEPVRSLAQLDDDLFETLPAGAARMQRDLAASIGRRL